MVDERDEAFRSFEIDQTEKNERILLNRVREIEIWRNEITLEENTLYEEIKVISDAYWENQGKNYKARESPGMYA